MGIVTLRKSRHEIDRLLSEAIQAGEQVDALPTDTTEEVRQFRDRYLAWESRAEAILQSSFSASGFLTSSPADDFNAASLRLLDLKVSATVIPLERVPEVRGVIAERIRVLASVSERLDVYESAEDVLPPASSGEPDGSIFLVHGQDLAAREQVRRFVERATGMAVVVLDEQPNKGEDLLGKLLAHALRAAFAVVLLTGDDVGGPNVDQLKPRARQNVILELGLFLGLLGRSKVAALYQIGVELPSDFVGVGYIPLDGDGWQMRLVKELRAAGIPASIDKTL